MCACMQEAMLDYKYKLNTHVMQKKEEFKPSH